MDVREQTNKQEPDSIRSRLWEFAVDVYAQPGVMAACLKAQEQWDIDVNLMLYAVWCAKQKVVLRSDDFQKAESRCQVWREAIILPLRKQRELWRGKPKLSADYEAIKGLELEAERCQLEFLADLFEQDQSDLATLEFEGRIDTSVLEAQLSSLARHYGLLEEVFMEFRVAVAGS
ncbi:TIGR02444 family protein [Congregibacter brevis]|uniref:TIGR02444 family protein n=1 Tax=Congregibacter brevis TaxID=3081201 RepID=A0ABZ0IH67_9GAMM|nr:TIGR02444 family protein [Congregibacter sp. IMCC45268]